VVGAQGEPGIRPDAAIGMALAILAIVIIDRV
jgi:preprotein translocase subunit Sec61beta